MMDVCDECVGSSPEGHQGTFPCKSLALPTKTCADGPVDGVSHGRGTVLDTPADISTEHNESSFTAERADNLVRCRASLVHRCFTKGLAANSDFDPNG